MNKERLDAGNESIGKIDFAPPAVELLLDPTKIDTLWPKDLVDNPTFKEQIETRRRTSERLKSVTSKLPRPDLPLDQALEQELIDEEQVANLYDSLSQLLNDPAYNRVALYVPFEFLPAADWKPTTATLAQSADAFRQSYLNAWTSLLTTQDVRANFVDGDVLDVESRTGDLPRVVKAAHLAPVLVQKGILSTPQVLELFDASSDPIFKQSLADALLVLADLKLLDEESKAQMRNSEDKILQGVLREIDTPASTVEAVSDEKHFFSFRKFEYELTEALKQPANINEEGITKKRVAWLTQEHRRHLVVDASERINKAIAQRIFSTEQFTSGATPESKQAVALGVGKALETIAKADTNKGKVAFEVYKKLLLKLWSQDEPGLREALATTFYRLEDLDVLDESELHSFGLVKPVLAGPFSENLVGMTEELSSIRASIQKAESDPELANYIYSAALLFGSRLKGYSTKTADLDVAIFIKPDIQFTDREKVRAALARVFTHEKLHGELVEFWLENTPEGLGVRDFGSTDPHLGESYWSHVLFGAAWEGNNAAIAQLREKLLVPYFSETDKKVHGRPARGLYLEELERDTLQYRLMHKGYARFKPAYGGIQTPHSSRIDSQSAFWDSGYRQTALKLFVDRVFLPKI